MASALQPPRAIGWGAFTTPFARVSNELFERIFLLVEEADLGRSRRVCGIWNRLIQDNLKLCIRLIPQECAYRVQDNNLAFRIQALFNLPAAREAANRANNSMIWFLLFKQEIAANNVDEAQTLIEKLGEYKDEGYATLARELIAANDFDGAMEVAIKIKDYSMRFSTYLEIAESDSNKDYSFLAEKLENRRYQKKLKLSELAAYHARCAKLFPPHDFSRAKGYAKQASRAEKNPFGFQSVILTQATITLNGALETFLEVPEKERSFILRQLVVFAAERNLEFARELSKYAQSDYEKHELEMEIAKRAPEIPPDVEKVRYKRFNLIIDRFRLGYKDPELLEEAKKIALTGYDIALIVEIEAKSDVSKAVKTIETSKEKLCPYSLARCWLKVAKSVPLYIPVARKAVFALKDMSDQVEELARITSAFSKLSL